MVSYQKWTSIMFEVAEEKGADTSKEQQAIIKAGSQLWREHKMDLSTATVAEAKNLARREVNVS